MILSEHLLSRISPEPNSGCWLWTGHITSGGYGRLGRTPAHRVTYSALKGAIPPGLDLDHLCRVRSCVNPDHLEAVTRQVNLLRGIGPQVQRERAARQTHCKHGHEYTPENTGRTTTGFRTCRECARLRVNPGPRRRFKDRCPSGHFYTLENTWRNKHGVRFCRTCQSLAGRKRYRVLRAMTEELRLTK